jgi:hypothetical protein
VPSSSGAARSLATSKWKETELSDGPVRAADVEAEAPEELVFAWDGGEYSREKLLEVVPEGYVAQFPIAALRLAKVNPNKGDVAAAIESLQEFGQHRPAVVKKKDGEIIVGNHMTKAALQMGWDALDVFFVADDDTKALRRAVADNAVGRRAQWEEQELADVMQAIGATPGFDQGEIDKLLEKLTPEEDKEEPTYPLVPRLNEEYDYVVIFAKNATDVTWLTTKFDLRQEKSYKSGAVARSHVLTVERVQELLGE